MNEINNKANMLQNESFKSYLLYHNYCKSDRRQEVRKEKECRTGGEESINQCFTIPFIPNNYP